MDIWTKEKRSDVMRRIKGKDTKPELILRSQLFIKGLRFRVHRKDLAGKPDIVLTKYNTVIFVHGCFWHYHKDCKEGKIPATNSSFWRQKLERNVAKDKANIRSLKKSNWNVLVVWECEIEKDISRTMRFLLEKIKGKD